MDEEKFFSDEEAEQAEKFLENIVGSILQAIGEAAEESGVKSTAKDARTAAEGAAVDALSEVIGFLKQAQDQVGSALDEMQTGLADAKKQYDLAKYRPVMEEELADKIAEAEMIVIADGEARKDIEVCQGALAWLETQGDFDVLYLYQEAIGRSGISFDPYAELGDVFLRDKADPKKFYNVGGYVKREADAKVAELKDIAKALGAKSIDIKELAIEKTVNVNVRVAEPEPEPVGDAQAVIDEAEELLRKYAPKAETKVEGKKVYKDLAKEEFAPAGEPTKPELVWFAGNQVLTDLIEGRFPEFAEGVTPALPTKYSIEMSGEEAFADLIEIAGKVDAALKAMGSDFSFSGEVAARARRGFAIEIEF